jgi:Kef-type K+ transport system membrane component KefB
VNLNQLIPLLVIFAALLIAYDLTQKYFVYRLIKKAKDKEEREAIIAALTRRWR